MKGLDSKSRVTELHHIFTLTVPNPIRDKRNLFIASAPLEEPVSSLQ